MSTLAGILIAIVALEHFGFLVLEMFLWRKPFGLKTFGLTQELADRTAAMGQNQGLYNGFLAAGLIYGWVAGLPQMVSYLLGCVIVAGLFGAVTVKRSILFVQALPAVLALAAYLLR